MCWHHSFSYSTPGCLDLLLPKHGHGIFKFSVRCAHKVRWALTSAQVVTEEQKDFI